MWIIVKNEELFHHGVKGMKWGVRKVKERINNAKAKSYYVPKSKMDAHRYAFKKATITGASQATIGLGLKYVLNNKGYGEALPSNKTYLISSGLTFAATLLSSEVAYARTGRIKKI